jgi:hypothetical protein
MKAPLSKRLVCLLFLKELSFYSAQIGGIPIPPRGHPIATLENLSTENRAPTTAISVSFVELGLSYAIQEVRRTSLSTVTAAFTGCLLYRPHRTT